MLKSYGGWWWVGGLKHFSVSPRPLGFGFGTKRFGAKGLGPGLDNIIKLHRNRNSRLAEEPRRIEEERRQWVCPFAVDGAYSRSHNPNSSSSDSESDSGSSESWSDRDSDNCYNYY